MAKKEGLRCSKCGRNFSMPAHLARHMNAKHASKAKRRAKTVGRRAAGDDVTGLRRDILAYRGKLVAQRTRLDSQIAAIERALAALGLTQRTAPAAIARGRRRAGPRKGSLKGYIERVLRARRSEMAVKDITTRVLRAGYKSKNKALAKSVGIALTQMPNVAKVARGTFRLG